eukprot:1526723-Heterocapsa_arctica.AAC.1
MAALLRHRWWNGGLLFDVAQQLGLEEELVYRFALESEKKMEDLELLKRFRMVEHQGHAWVHIVTHTKKFLGRMYNRKKDIEALDWPVPGEERVPAQDPPQVDG